MRQLAPGASPSRPAPRAAISRAGRAIPRRNQRFRPGGAASPAEAQPPSTLSLKSSARIELLVARCAAVSSRIGRSACRAPRCAAPWGASPSRFRYRALVVDERLNGRRTRSARLGAHLAALRDSTSAARSQEAASPLHGHHCRRNRPSPVLLCFKSQPRTSDSLAQRICISPSSLDLWFLLSPVTPVSYISAGDAPRLTPDPLPRGRRRQPTPTPGATVPRPATSSVCPIGAG